jgi:hypothetical protein
MISSSALCIIALVLASKMISSSALCIITLVVALAATNAFTAPQLATNLHRGPLSPIPANQRGGTRMSAVLDGIYYQQSNAITDSQQHAMCELGLLRDESNKLPSGYMSSILTDLVGLTSYDAQLTLEQASKWGLALIDEFPFHQAEYYYEQLTLRGIPCTIVSIDE